mmetsp:Transcript_29952/g.76979  ORF Transcript_29952/g.76979 Transcript_29952/m.76979 type:complete len:222 (+) Transcript_29952:1003-1668(+)
MGLCPWRYLPGLWHHPAAAARERRAPSLDDHQRSPGREASPLEHEMLSVVGRRRAAKLAAWTGRPQETARCWQILGGISSCLEGDGQATCAGKGGYQRRTRPSAAQRGPAPATRGLVAAAAIPSVAKLQGHPIGAQARTLATAAIQAQAAEAKPPGTALNATKVLAIPAGALPATRLAAPPLRATPTPPNALAIPRGARPRRPPRWSPAWAGPETLRATTR